MACAAKVGSEIGPFVEGRSRWNMARSPLFVPDPLNLPLYPGYRAHASAVRTSPPVSLRLLPMRNVTGTEVAVDGKAGTQWPAVSTQERETSAPEQICVPSGILYDNRTAYG